MDEEAAFAALYKKLIDRHFTPRQQRAQLVLRAVMGRLSDRGPPAEPEYSEAPSGKSRKDMIE